MGIDVYERYDVIEPEIPTNIWEVWLPRAALDPNVLRDYEDWPRRALPGDVRVQDLEGPALLLNLPRDDEHRLGDVINVDRRAVDRQLQSNGFMAGEVDEPPDNNPWWHQYLVWAGALVFIVGGVLIVMFRSGG